MARRRRLNPVSATASAHSDQASRAATRRLNPPTLRACSLARSVIISLYSTNVHKALQNALRGLFSEPRRADARDSSTKREAMYACKCGIGRGFFEDVCVARHRPHFSRDPPPPRDSRIDSREWPTLQE